MTNPTKNLPADPHVLILAANGKTGRRVADRLEERGVRTRRASRGGTPPFDWDDASTWPAALDGIDAVYVVYTPDLAVPAAPAAIEAFTEMAVRSGVRRLVLLSGRGEEEAQRCEEIVQRAGVDWTIVRASWFSQNFTEGPFRDLVLGGTIALPVGDVGEPFVDVDDIADVAVAALTEDRHDGRVYEVTGPRLLTFADAADEIARATGREVRFLRISDEDFVAGLLAEGVPGPTVELLLYLFTHVLDGRNSHLTSGVRDALGRPPRDFADFARDAARVGVWERSEQPAG